jgi:hypothetical protein
MVKAKSPRKRLNDVLNRLDEIKERRAELHEEYLKAKSAKKQSRIKDKIRRLDLLLETNFYQAQKAYKKFPDELEEVARYKAFDGKSRVVLCDGEIHLVTSKKGKHKYGYFCNC